MEGKIIAICKSDEKGKPKQNIGCGFLEKGVGLVGDAHAGTKKEITLLAKEDIDRISRESGIEFPPGCFAENITTSGINLLSLPLGAKLKVGKAIIEISQKGKDPGQAHIYSFKGHSLLPKFGLFAKVVKSGEARIGNPLEEVIE